MEIIVSEHLKTKTPTDADLKGNPGIGMSKGTSIAQADPDDILSETTFEGDVGNDTNPQGGVDPDQIGRTNK